MHLFLDTTVFYEDPFLEKPHTKSIIKIFQQNNFQIYISNVVLMETRRHFENKLKEHISNYNKSVSYLETNSYKYFHEKNIDIDSMVKSGLEKFDRHYNKQNSIKILEYKNEILPELIDRSIHRIKPFTENKQEFRDAIIWLTYSKYVEVNQLDNCFFITNNSSDYLYKQELHKDLKKDTERIKIYQQPYGFLYSDTLKPYLETNKEFEDFKYKWSNMNIEERQNILNTYFKSDEVLNEVTQYVKTYIEHSSFQDLYYRGSGEGSSKFNLITDIKFENNETFTLNSGIIALNATFTINAKTEDAILLANNEKIFNENKVELELYFSCNIDPETYEIEDFIINSHYNLKEEDEQMALMNRLNHL